ncbi:MAG: bifunctional shikimate kinase/3-dehydroquinate synthase [Solirubrobacterales bacterium]|nr:bifunctional shikimate kinase/3-dehydroquinate synthase [Solirubrobacterales bacterium]
MGAGKSAAARGAARALGTGFVDTDRLIAEQIPGGSISGYFREHGEPAFRELEERVVLEALDRFGEIVALGGGAVESERIRAALAGHVTAWCRVEEEVAWERSSGTDRPLARDRDGFRRRWSARRPLYEDCGRVVLPSGGEQIGFAAAPWLDALRDRPEVRMYWSRTPSGDAPAVVGPGATRLFDDAPALRPGVRLFGMADRDAYAAAGGLMPAVEGEPVLFAGGETAKTVGGAEALLRELARAGVRREDALLAFGGGVAGDLAGFCAAVYQRGIPVVQVPTTLVAQVDSAYGGKTGVDLPEGKNYVGCFHQPAAVLTDPEALRTLPAAELAAGFAEVVKTALIAGGPLWERVRDLEVVDADSVAPLVFDCAATKLGVVGADERDSGLRAVLNLGHTVGHGIEAATGYERYRHGEAISIGLVAALRLSGAEGLGQEVAALLDRAGLPTSLDAAVDAEAVLDAVGRDKKRTAEGIGFVTISAPGEVRFGQRIDAASLRRVVEELAR